MRVLVSSEHRFDRTPDGSIWTANVNAYSFWKRYLDVFDEVRVLARIRDVSKAHPAWIRADGPYVHFCAIPYFLGPMEYMLHHRSVKNAINTGIADCEAVIMRVPSLLSHKISKVLRVQNHPFALEVVGDPYDVFSRGGIRHPARPFFRWQFSSVLRRQCRQARAVAYVTAQTLQRRYPCQALMVGISDVALPEGAFTATYSSVELASDQIAGQARVGVSECGRATLAFVGSLAQLYKAPDILLQAMAKLVRSGVDVYLNLIGDGRYRCMLERMAQTLGIYERCNFLGELPAGEPVRHVLDQSDIFVLPSRVEGLPRAIIEAMARGLPCIGSTVGGIPELLPAEDLVKPGDVDSLAALIRDVMGDPSRQKHMSLRNLAESRKYADDVLKSKRIAFYQGVKDITAAHVWTHSASSACHNDLTAVHGPASSLSVSNT